MKNLRVAALTAVVVLTAAAFAQDAQPSLSDMKYQHKIGVLPFVDNSGSGEDVGNALSRAVQSEIVHSTQLVGRVMRLDDSTKPDDLDQEKAVDLGRQQKVDVVLVGTVLEAQSQESEHDARGPSIFGQSVGGTVRSVSAVVTLQGDLFNVTTGKKIDSIRVSGNASQSKVSTQISTQLGDMSSGGEGFDKSPIGKALHQAVANLVQRIAGNQAKFIRYTGNPPPKPADQSAQ